MLPFAETTIEILGYDYGVVGGRTYNNTVIQTAGGATQINVNWDEPLGRWQLGDRRLHKRELEYLIRFHNARMGSAQPFRFLDWSDYELRDELIGVGNGVQAAFQATKTYKDEWGTNTQKIYKLAKGVRCSVPAQIDLNTGIVTPVSVSPVGTEIRVTGNYHRPVRFEQDKIDYKFISADPSSGEAFFDIGALSVVEVRI